MTTASVSTRQELLDLLEDILRHPEKYGDRFFLEAMKRSNDGMVLISFLHSLVMAIGNYPIEYIQHCIPLDTQSRFRLSLDQKKIGLFDHPSNAETDSFGYIKQIENEEQGEANAETMEQDSTESTETAGEDRSRTIYKPSIHSRLLETEKREALLPTIYHDGKFFIDDEHTKQHDPIEGTLKFEYDIPDMNPLGSKTPIDRFAVHTGCFNCGEAHKIGDCPLPVNKDRVERNKRSFYNDSIPFGRRLHIELDIQDRISKVAPGVLSDSLRDALGMMDQELPPYYKNMRWYGYPPGYLGKEGYQIPYGTKLTLEDVVRSKEPLLKIYDDDSPEVEMADISDDDTNGRKSGNKSRQQVQLVYYPGLNIPNTSKLDKHMDSVKSLAPAQQQQHRDDHMNDPSQQQQQQQQQYWNQYYAQENQQQQQQHQQYNQYHCTTDHFNYSTAINEGPFYPPGTAPLQPTDPVPNKPPPADQTTSRVENPIWSMLRQRRYPQQATRLTEAITLLPVVDEDDNQSVDMDISSDDDG